MGSEMDSVDEQVRAPVAPTRGNNSGGLRAFLWEILQTVLLTLVIFLAVRAVVQNFKVEGASMEPSLHSGQYLLINKIGYARLQGTPAYALVHPDSSTPSDPGYLFGGPQRGDIIVFRSPVQPDKDFIKRVIGVPGDTVEIRGGQVLVNGAPLDESYIRDRPPYVAPRQVVPPGHYFVLGDNRPNSSDSHVWGLVPADNIIGKAWVSYWPPNLWGVLAEPVYAR
jgi:signal peptidase I